MTGRFLTPGDNGQNSPFVPLGGATLAPILILALIGRKKKGKIWTGWVVIALMTSVGLALTACEEQPTQSIFTNPPTPMPWPKADPATVVTEAKKFVGDYLWHNPTDNDFYNYFIMDKGKENGIVTMNCYEMILLARYKVGNISKDWIKNFYYSSARTTWDAEQIAMWNHLGANSATLYDHNNPPQLGDLVFFTIQGDGYASSYPTHVALSEGGGKVISLWYGPQKTAAVQETTVEEIKDWILELPRVKGVTITVGPMPQ